jgi:hypothetical protein
MGRLYLLGFIGLCYLYPKQVAQWFVSAIVAFVAAYLTTDGKLAPFEGMFLINYILIQIIFSIWNRRHKVVKV